MERLTKKHYGGNGYYMACSEHCNKECFDCKEIDKIIDRLGTYEDTGLEPEDVRRLQKDWTSLIITIDEMGCMPHLRELYEAEKEGRLVVLPCKVGDTVYEISNNTDACNGCQHYDGIYGSGESWCAQIDDVDLRYYPNIAERPLCEKQFMEVVEHKPEIDWIFTHRNDFGKTVFLTREEAEAALKGGESDA